MPATPLFARRLCLLTMALLLWFADGTQADTRALEQAFTSPSESAKPWTFWYWLDAAVTAEGITADLESMRDAGLGGAYLMPIYGPQDPPAISPPATQLSPHWWKLVRHAAEESDRLGLRLAMHLADGFALAGGPWITPELSMQQLVWSRAAVAGGKQRELELEQPLSREGFYRDIAVLAFPAPAGEGISTATAPVTVTTNAAGQQSQQLVVPGNTERLRSAEPCWIAFRFEEPFTCRSVTIRPDGNNHQCQRLRLEASDDGLTFRPVARLSAPRHGWQDEGRPVTHAVPTTTARRFRLVFDPAGAEPGAEDLDGAKWSPVLKVQGIELSSAGRVHQFRGKSGEVWRVTSPEQHSNPLAGISRQSIVDLTNQMDDHGVLRWDAPPGEWVVLRFGHTSTGMRNATGGGAQGLECDKLNPQAVREQYQGWFGEARRRLGSELTGKVLTRLHVDSWECGSQNWTADMPQRFAKRRGYDATRWLPAVAGYVIDDGESSERFLHDFRLTIAEQLDESFFGTLESLADDAGVKFSAECTAPTMLGDGLRHFQHVDMPMGEFWRDSPTHDKPNDIRDAVSAGHIYGKHVIGAEAFTQLRIGWDETPNILRPLADRHFCLGVNQLVHHVWMHNPWFDRKPGVTLNGIGTFLQRDQVWQAQAHAWNGYLQRLQAVLRQGDPVVDIAVFTGEELPSRAVLPERLVSTLPGLIGKKRLASETERLANRGAPLRELPAGVKHSANMTDPADWLDPLRGYQYDSINRDALLRLAKVRGDRIVLPGGASYAVLVIPAARPMSPAPGLMSVEVAEKLLELADAGGKLLLGAPPKWTPSLTSWEPSSERLARLAGRLADHPNVMIGAWRGETLDPLGVGRDLQAWDREGSRSSKVAWTHRRGAGWDAYLIVPREPVRVATRADRRHSQVWDPVTGERRAIAPQGGSEGWEFAFAANQSVLLVCSDLPLGGDPYRLEAQRLDALKNDKWQVGFESAVGASPSPIELSRLADLSEHNDPAVRAFAGTAVYASTFDDEADDLPARRVWLDLGEIAGMARVKVNGSDCGVAWTPPYRVEVTDALHAGENQLEVEVAGVWRNRILADQELPEHERLTWTNARALPESAGPVPFGLLGPVRLETMTPQAERPQE